jgi:hypothetical protein
MSRADGTGELLRAILEATRRGSLKWRQAGPEEFEASGPLEIKVVQVTPLIAGETDTAGPQAFEVTAERVCFYVWDGSVGCELVRQILSAGLASWADHTGRIDRETRRMIQKLKRPNKRKR